MITEIPVPAANGNGDAAEYQGGAGTLWADGDATAFDSGTLTVQVRPNSSAQWQSAVDTDGVAITFSAAGHKHVWYGGTPQFRCVLSGSNGSTTATLEIHYGVANVRDSGPGVSL